MESNTKGCMNCGNISCPNNKKRVSAGCGRWKTPEQKIIELEEENSELREKNEGFQRACSRMRDMGFPTFASVKEYAAKLQELENENAELKEFINAPHTKGRKTTRADYIKTVWDLSKQLTKAKEITLMLYNAGRDVLMCRNEEKAYDNLSKAVNDKSIEQFISEVEK